MILSIETGNITGIQTDALALIYPEDANADLLSDLPANLKRPIQRLLGSGDFTGELKETSLLYPEAGDIPRLLIVGCGKSDALNFVENIRQSYGQAVRELRAIKGANSVLFMPPRADAQATPDILQAAAEASLLGYYRFDKYKAAAAKKDTLDSMSFLANDRFEMIQACVERAQIIADGTNLARDLSNEPSNHLTPSVLAARAASVAEATGLRCEIFDKAMLEAQGFGSLLAVAQGSAEEPRFIVLEYTPEGTNSEETDQIVLLGKGIMYDSGGINLKPSVGGFIEAMKHDMSGASSVLGAMEVIGRLKPPNVRVIGVLAAAENMPSGTAIKPGDVITAYGGKTIEILNTDAEGRLVLADALGWVSAHYKPNAVFTLATLTGAVIAALGKRAAAALSDNSEIMAKVKSAAIKTHELVWELPSWDSYHQDVTKNTIASVRNTGEPRQAGTIAGYAFLKQFSQELPFLHFDIAGVSWDVDGSAYISEGATGWGTRLLTDLVENWHA